MVLMISLSNVSLIQNKLFSDIRPTFLFWARGRPVALLRGANRPLLTRLISEEVRMEVSKREREYIEIDFESDKVIQVRKLNVSKNLITDAFVCTFFQCTYSTKNYLKYIIQ